MPRKSSEIQEIKENDTASYQWPLESLFYLVKEIYFIKIAITEINRKRLKLLNSNFKSDFFFKCYYA